MSTNLARTILGQHASHVIARAVAALVLGTGSIATATALQWDNTAGTSGAQGGTGTWNAANTNWWSGSANVAFNSVTPDSSTFGATAGTVTLSGTPTTSAFQIDTTGYVFSLSSTNGVYIKGPFTINQPVTFNMNLTGNSGNFADPLHWNRGLQFFDNVTIPSNVTINSSAANQWAIVGLTGAGKTLSFQGTWDDGTAGSVNSRIALAGGSKLLVKAGAKVNNNNPDAINARRWEVGSDGNVNNVVEFEEGFDADVAHNNTMGDGLSTFRIGTNVTWITHATQSLPSIYKLGNSGVVTHHGLLAFDAVNTGSKWVVASNTSGTDQLYGGQVGYDGSWTLETQSNLIFDGFIHGNTSNPNGAAVAWWGKGGTMTKIGAGTFDISGNQGYKANSAYDIQQGTIRFNTDPAQVLSYDVANTGQNLIVKVSGTGIADFNLAVGTPTWWNSSGTGIGFYDPNPAPGTPRTGPAGPAPTQGSILSLQLSTGGTVRVATAKTAITPTLTITSGTGNVNAEGTGMLKVIGTSANLTMSANTTLAKAGTGLLWLDSAATQSYATGTQINVTAGTLRVDSTSGTGTASASISGTGILAGTGNFLANVSVSAGGDVAPGASIGSLAVNALTLALGADLDLELAAPGTGDRVIISSSGGLNLAGPTLVNIADSGGLGVGTYTILDYAGALGGSVANLSPGSAPAGFQYDFVNNAAATTIELKVSLLPEPAALGAVAIVSVGLLRRRNRR